MLMRSSLNTNIKTGKEEKTYVIVWKNMCLVNSHLKLRLG